MTTEELDPGNTRNTMRLSFPPSRWMQTMWSRLCQRRRAAALTVLSTRVPGRSHGQKELSTSALGVGLLCSQGRLCLLL